MDDHDRRRRQCRRAQQGEARGGTGRHAAGAQAAPCQDDACGQAGNPEQRLQGGEIDLAEYRCGGLDQGLEQGLLRQQQEPRIDREPSIQVEFVGQVHGPKPVRPHHRHVDRGKPRGKHANHAETGQEHTRFAPRHGVAAPEIEPGRSETRRERRPERRERNLRPPVPLARQWRGHEARELGHLTRRQGWIEGNDARRRGAQEAELVGTAVDEINGGAGGMRPGLGAFERGDSTGLTTSSVEIPGLFGFADPLGEIRGSP